MTPTEQPSCPIRLHDIDRSKGLGICLVVWGHLAGAGIGVLPLWFYISVTVVYQFHMPLFMYLSGFVFFLIAANDRFWKAPLAYLWKRFDRLMVPFLAFGAIVVIGKYFAEGFGNVDDQVGSIWGGIGRVLTNAPDNPSISIWYLLVLFVYSVLTPLLWRVGRRRIIVLLAIGAIGWLLPLPEDFYLRRIAIYYIFFVVGGLTALHRERILPVLARWWWAALLALAASCWLLLDSPVALLVCGLIGPLAIHGLFLQPFWRDDRVFLTLGRYSMAIYLMNTIVIGVAKLVWARVLPVEGMYAPLFLVSVFTVAIVVPMLVRRFVLIVPWLRPLGRYIA